LKIKYINKFEKKNQIYKSEEKIITNKTIFPSKGGIFRLAVLGHHRPLF